MGGEANACFARSKSMDLNDFLIHSKALNIRLSRNLITQSYGDRFHEYINKWQLFSNSYVKQKQLNLFIYHSNNRRGDKTQFL